MRLTYLWPLVTAGMLACPVVMAAPAMLSRTQAVEQALAQNPQLHALGRQVEAAEGRRLQADGFESPTIYWEFEEADSLSGSDIGSQVFGIEQSIEWFGVRSARKKAADFGIAAARALVERGRKRLAARVRKAYDQVLQAHEVQRLLRAVLQLTDEAVAISRTRFKAGAGQYVDVMRTRLRQSQLRNALRDAATEVSRNERQLARLLGHEGAPLKLSDRLVYEAVVLDPQTWLDQLAAQSPSLHLLQGLIRQAEAEHQAVRAGRGPAFNIGIGRQRVLDNGNRTDSWAGSVSVSMPLPGSDRQDGLEAEALARFYTISDQATARRLHIDASFRQRLDEAYALDAQLRQFRESILPDADDQLKAAQQAYRVRSIDALNLLDVFATYTEARRGYLEVLVRYRAAITDLETLGEDLWEVEL
ncbi:MAG TPA: TolC family protein [Gammaproteobacteria bacterium]|nr:TolC family protein [Gammaproteobacteria bacterium]